jgi:hypothetical protein
MELLPAGARAGVPQDHDCGRGSAGLASGPALPEVGAPRLLADGVQLQITQLGIDGGVLGAAGDRLLHPLGLGQGALPRPHLHRVREVPERRHVFLQLSPQFREPPRCGRREATALTGRGFGGATGWRRRSRREFGPGRPPGGGGSAWLRPGGAPPAVGGGKGNVQARWVGVDGTLIE